MAVPVDAITATLQADPVLTGLATGGVFDHDLRRSNESLPVDAMGDVRSVVLVDDAGGGRDPFGPSGMFSDRVMVWFFAPLSRPGRVTIEAMTARTLAILHRWRDPATGTTLFHGDRLGVQATDAPDSSYMDRLTFKVTGVAEGVAW